MYLLRHTEGEEVFYLLEDREYVVGRKNTDIVISNDQSISRKHSIIKIGSDSVTLTDCASKYGTLHNETKIAANTGITVNDKDMIKFGVFNSIYRLEKLNIVTTGSGLSNEQKNQLKRKLAPIGGTVLNNWDDTCINVTAQEIMLTIKVLHTLIDNKPIVTLEYWDQFIGNMKENKPPPNPNDFKPPIAESLFERIKLSPNPGRKSLFKNKTFVFPSEKVKNKMSDLIVKTGGVSISWEKQTLTLSQVSKSKNDYLFIHCEEVQNIPQSLKEIYQHLTKIGERTIPIQEIAMAVVLCSCEKDCNPKFNRLHSVFKEQPIDSCSEMFPLASETPSDDMCLNEAITKKELIIPESLDADLQVVTPCSSKDIPQPPPKRTEKENDNNPAKRIRLEPSLPDSQTNKRKAEDTIAPAKKKSTLKENPFAVLRNKISANKTTSDNPFAAMRITKEIKTDVDNPFKSPVTENENIPKKTENLFNSTPIKSVASTSVASTSVASTSVASTSVASTSSIPRYSPSDASNIKWIDRSCAAHKEIDPECRQTFEEFKNITLIETLPDNSLISFPPKFISEGLEGSSYKKNFKKFKKAKPLYLQTTIIQVVSPDSHKENVSIIITSDGEEEKEEEENEIERPVVKKTKTKNRFNF